MRLALISLVIIGGVSTAVACGGPMDAGSPGPAQTPNAGRDPAAIDPADEVRSDDPGGNSDTSPDASPKEQSTSAVTTGGFLPTSSSGSSGSTGSTGGGPTTASTGTGFR
jgi:hypothetical protein